LYVAFIYAPPPPRVRTGLCAAVSLAQGKCTISRVQLCAMPSGIGVLLLCVNIFLVPLGRYRVEENKQVNMDILILHPRSSRARSESPPSRRPPSAVPPQSVNKEALDAGNRSASGNRSHRIEPTKSAGHEHSLANESSTKFQRAPSPVASGHASAASRVQDVADLETRNSRNGSSSIGANTMRGGEDGRGKERAALQHIAARPLSGSARRVAEFLFLGCFAFGGYVVLALVSGRHSGGAPAHIAV
jgi:hypothetical protein